MDPRALDFDGLVQRYFADALECSAQERRSLLAQLSQEPDGERIREEVEALLLAHEAAGDYLAEPSAPFHPSWASPEPAEPEEDLIGVTIGPYVVRECLGEGGFGRVYRAAQTEPIRREVALKMIKRGMDTHQVVNRFENERQALAVMDHPAIAKVFDAGASPSGRPYFVMELVHGVPITEFCDIHQLSITERLQIFCDVCLAVQHAHQKGVIHRDLKPTNILVAMTEDGPRAKVIDFGIAKAILSSSEGESRITMEGQFLGTPEYMSPEQIGLSDSDVDTRSDLFSLGVLLYQLLTGALPFSLPSSRPRHFHDLRRLICEVDPPKPSTKLRQMSERDASTGVLSRNPERRSLIRRLRGDLDWITLKAMEKERARRYASASELAEDLQRHLNDEPVGARPPSVHYRAGKFIRRNKTAVSASLLIVLVLIGGIMATSWAMVEAQHQRNAARDLAYRSTIVAGAAAIAASDFSDAAHLLEQAPSERRGWEWKHLQSRLDHASVVIPGTGTPVPDLAVSNDGEHIFAVVDERIVRYDAATGEPTATFSINVHPRHRLSMGPGGNKLLIEEQRGPWFRPDSRLVMVDLDADAILWRREGACSGEHAFLPDGTLIAAGLLDENAVAWIDASSGTELMRQRVDGGNLIHVGMAADGAIFYATAGEERMGVAGIVDRFGERTTLRREHLFLRLNFAPVLRAFAWEIWTDGRVIVADFETETPRIIPERPGHNRSALAWSEDGRWMAIAEGREILLWDTATWEPAGTLAGHRERVVSGRFSPRGDRLVTGDAGGTIRIWNMPSPSAPWMVEQWENWKQYDAALSPDGSTIATAGWSFVRLWDLPAGTIRTIHNQQSRYVERIAFSPDGRKLALASHNRGLRIIDTDSGITMTETDFIGDSSLAWHPGGSPLFWLDRDAGEIVLIDDRTGAAIDRLSVDNASVTHFQIGRDGLVALAAIGNQVEDGRETEPDHETVLVRLDLETMRFAPKQMMTPPSARLLAVASHGPLAAVVGADNTVELWDFAHHRMVWRTHLTAAAVESLAFSHDGQRLALGRVGAIDLIDCDDGQRQAVLRHEIGRVINLFFTPGDAALVACGLNHPMVVFDARAPDRQVIRERSRKTAARAIVDPLFESLYVLSRVEETLHADPQLNGWKREASLAYARARGDHLAALGSDTVFAIEAGRFDRALAACLAIQRGSISAPERWESIIAMLHYLLDEPDAAAEAIERYRRWTNRPHPLTAGELALIALLAHGRGEHAEAERAWAESQAASRDRPFNPSTLERHLWRKAESTFLR